MNFLKLIKQLFFFFLVFLLGTQTTHAKTELIVTQNQVSFPIEKTHFFTSLEIDYLESLYNQVSTADPSYASTENMQHTYTWIQNVKADYLAVVTGQKLPLRYNVINILNTLGAFDKYEYSVLDLIAREKLKRDNGGDILTAVLSSESEGRAQPLNMSEGYQQYINHHDTESAFFLGFEYMKMYVDNFFEPAALIQVIAKAKSIRNIFKSHKSTRPKNLDDIFKGGVGNVGGNWFSTSQMRALTQDWATSYRQGLTSNNQLSKFNKACTARWKNAPSGSESVFNGRNGGILNNQSAHPTISAKKGLGIHPELANKLPANTQWPNTANCAECDAVNQALWEGANWSDIQIHTIDIRPNGTMTDVIQCSECMDIFDGMRVTSQ